MSSIITTTASLTSETKTAASASTSTTTPTPTSSTLESKNANLPPVQQNWKVIETIPAHIVVIQPSPSSILSYQNALAAAKQAHAEKKSSNNNNNTNANVATTSTTTSNNNNNDNQTNDSHKHLVATIPAISTTSSSSDTLSESEIVYTTINSEGQEVPILPPVPVEVPVPEIKILDPNIDYGHILTITSHFQPNPEYVIILASPFWEEDRAASLGDVPIRVPRDWLKYDLRPTYVKKKDMIYLNAVNGEFYEKASTLPSPILNCWILGKHNGFPHDKNYVKRRIVEEMMRKNVNVTCLNPDKFDLEVSKEGLHGFVYQGKRLKLPDFVIPRVGAVVDYFGLAVLRQLAALGVHVFNGIQSIEISRDKLYTYQILAANGVSIPRTVLGKIPVEYDYVEHYFGYPVIIKQVSGSKGQQVWKAENKEEVENIAKTLDPKVPYVFQEYLHLSKGRDIRAFVVGGKVVACMMRIAAKGGFKANIHQGGRAESVTLQPRLEKMVLRTAALCQLDFAGVDVLLDRKYKICEVNSSPGFEGLERATGINVSKSIVDFVIQKMTGQPPTPKIPEEEEVPIQDDHNIQDS